jgi:Glyoxalase-like domain
MRRPDSTRRLALESVGAGYSLENSMCSRKAFSRAEVRLVGAAVVADQPSRRGRGPGTYPGAVIEYCSGQYPRMRLDHVSYAVAADDLAQTVQRLGAQLGAAFSDGGLHPRFGTRNFVLPLEGGCYVEVVSPLDHPAVDRAPFGQAVKRRAKGGGGWLGWVVAVPDITPVEQRLGRSAVDGHRHRPDGTELRWKQIGVMDLMDDPQLPFFVQWLVGGDQHPSAWGSPVRLESIELAGEAETISSWLGEPGDHPLDEVSVQWLDPSAVDGESGIVAVLFATPHGLVRVE